MEAGKKQKILLVHNYYQIPGGEDTVVANEMKILQRHGHEVIQYTRNNSELKQFSLLRKLILPVTTVFNPRTYRDIKRIIRREKIDIVHVHNTLNLISPAVYYAARRCKIPVVQTIHNFRLLCPGATFYRDGHICEDCLSKGLGCAVKHSCYRGSKIQTLVCVITAWIHRMTGIYGKINYICLTEFNREKLLQLKQISPERVFVKPNFVVRDDTEIVPYEKRKNQFIYAGRLDKLKGIDVLFQAWKLMGEKAPKLLVCGTGPMEQWCRDFIVENNLKCIELLGFVPNEEARKLMGESKAMILPTQWYEGFPMTIVEAYSMGTPVLGSDMGNVGTLISETQSGFCFLNNSAEDLKDTVLGYCKTVNRELYSQIRDHFKNKYTEIQNYSILTEIYNKLIDGTSNHADIG